MSGACERVDRQGIERASADIGELPTTYSSIGRMCRDKYYLVRGTW